MKLVLEHIYKSYGKQSVLEDIQLSIEGNSLYCLIGRNGAGKTTLLNMVIHNLLPDSGRIHINGMDYGSQSMAIKALLGVQIHEDQLIQELSLREYLFFIGSIYSMNPSAIREQTEHLIDYFYDDSEDIDKSIELFSTGMKKKAGICAALIHKPQILILDEPFANLDPVSSDLLCRFLIQYKNEKRVILVSSHDLLYVDKIATHIGVLHNKRLLFNGNRDSFREKGSASLDTELLKLISTPETEALQTHLTHLI